MISYSYDYSFEENQYWGCTADNASLMSIIIKITGKYNIYYLLRAVFTHDTERETQILRDTHTEREKHTQRHTHKERLKH